MVFVIELILVISVLFGNYLFAEAELEDVYAHSDEYSMEDNNEPIVSDQDYVDSNEEDSYRETSISSVESQLDEEERTAPNKISDEVVKDDKFLDFSPYEKNGEEDIDRGSASIQNPAYRKKNFADSKEDLEKELKESY